MLAQKRGGSDKPAAFVSVFFDQGKAYYHNKFIESLKFGELAKYGNYNTVNEVDFKSFMGGLDVSKYYEYQGSLTTPPCTEGITWFIIPGVQSLSKLQLRDI